MIALYRTMGIELRGNANVQKVECPECQKAGKSQNDSLSVKLSDRLYKCHRCGFEGRIKEPQEGQTSAEPFERGGKKIGRNEPCHCGSGKKYKQCHGKLT